MAKGEGALEGMRELALRARPSPARRPPRGGAGLGLLARRQGPARGRGRPPRAPRDPAGGDPDHRRRAGREAPRLAPQPPPGQGGTADRRARGPDPGPVLGGGPAGLDPARRSRDRLIPPALPGAARGRGRDGDNLPRSPCAPISRPVATSPRQRPRWASIAAPSASGCRRSSGSSAARSTRSPPTSKSPSPSRRSRLRPAERARPFDSPYWNSRRPELPI